MSSDDTIQQEAMSYGFNRDYDLDDLTDMPYQVELENVDEDSEPELEKQKSKYSIPTHLMSDDYDNEEEIAN